MNVPTVFRTGGIEYEMNLAVFAVLFHRAQQNLTVEYYHVQRACGVRPGEIGWTAGNISEWTSKRFKHVFLSVFVVSKKTQYPSGGFFGLKKIPKSLKRTEAEFDAP